MFPVSPSVQRQRLTILVAVGALLVLSPLPFHAFGFRARGAPRWSMFSEVGLDVCVATYIDASDNVVLARWAVLEPGVEPKSKSMKAARLRSDDTWARRAGSVCAANPRASQLDAELYCPGLNPEHQTREDVCGAGR